MNPLRRKSFIYLAATAIGLGSVGFAVAREFFTGYSWSNPAGGAWSSTANWTPTGAPINASDTATVPAGGGALTVNLDTSPTIMWVDFTNTAATLNLNSNTLTLTDPLGLKNAGLIQSNGSATINGNITNLSGANLNVNQNMTLTLNSPLISNAGSIVVNPPGGFDSILRFASTSHVSGLGSIQINGDNVGDRIDTTGGATLFNEGGHTIMGRGLLAALLNNSATVNANVSGQILHMGEQNVTNTGTLKASNGGTLRIAGITVSNAGGTLLGDGGDVSLEANTLVIGGTINRTGTSAVRAGGPATLQNVTIAASGVFEVNQHQTATLKGTSLTNNGLVKINHAGGFDSALIADDNLSLLGNGVMWLNGDNIGDFIGTTAGKALTNGGSHTIRGRGAITARLNNNSIVQADVSGQNFDMITEAKSNQGTMRALDGGILRFLGIAVNNVNGVIRNVSGSVHVGSGATIMNGTLDGVITAISAATLSDVTIAASGQYNINNNTSTSVLGSNIINNGLILVNTTGGFDASMIFSSNILLGGTGLLRINGDTAGDTLDTTGGFALTQATTHAIKGRGSIKADFVNNGLVDADNSGGPLELLDKQKHNPGIMRASAGGLLRMTGVDLDNGGRLEAVGGNIVFGGNARIAGGNFFSSGTSALMGEGAVTLVNNLIETGSEYRVRTNQTTTLEGSFLTNNGKFLINDSGGFDSVLLVNSNVAVGGSGHIQINGDTDGDTIDTAGAFTFTNSSGHKIHGRGSIKGKLTNNGTVEADFAGGPLRLIDKAKKNAGFLKAVSNATLFIGVAIDNLSGTIESNGGTVQVGTGGVITQGLLTGPSNFDGVGAATLADLIIDDGSTYRVMTNQTTTLSGATVTNNGTILVNPSAAFDSALSVDGDVQLLGNGEVVINGDTVGDLVSTTTGSKLTIGPDQTIHGLKGSIKGHIENKGTIRSDTASGWLVLQGEEDGFLNKGLIEPTNSGRIDIQDGTLFENAGNVNIPESQLLRVLTNNYRQTAGKTTVLGTMQMLNGDVVLEGGLLQGKGTISGDVDNATGIVGPGTSTGTLTIQGTYHQAATAKMVVEINGGTDADKLVVSGTANLAGTLELVLTNGFVPTNGTQYEIVTSTGLTGNFEKINFTNFPGTMSAVVFQSSNKIIVQFTDVPATAVNPASYTLTGTSSASPVSTLFSSDDVYLAPKGVRSMPFVLTTTGTAPVITINSIEVVVETKGPASLPMTVEAFDYTSNAWVLLDSRLSTAVDQSIRVVLTSTGRFIQTGTRQMQIRVTMTAPPSSRTLPMYDQVSWQLR